MRNLARWTTPPATCVFGIAVLTTAVLTTGCVTSPGPISPNVAAIDYGPYPDDYEALVQEWLQDRRQSEYATANVQITPPERGWYRAPVAVGGITTYGYKSFVSFSLNAQPGARVTRHKYLFLFRNGRVALARPAEDLRILDDS